MSQPVHPVSTTGGNMAPPPYTVGVGAAPVTVEMQPVVMQPTYLQTQPAVIQITQPASQTVTTVVVAHQVKRTHMKVPYLEYCPRCQTTITTRVEHKPGTGWWIICFIGTFLFCWPILFFLCCDCSKDAVHYCPNCGTMLAINKR